ncbi:MAG: radical SAM protein [Pseudomonadota bacterium]
MFVSIHRDQLINDLQDTRTTIEPTDAELLVRLWKNPERLSAIAPDPESELGHRLQRLLDGGGIVEASVDETVLSSVKRIDIETTRACNARCGYCPQSTDPKPAGRMAMPLFEKILDLIQGLAPEWIALNHYNEPLLDPHFRERIEALERRNLPLRLFTNGTHLGLVKREDLKQCDVHGIVFNFPALDPDVWGEMMRLPRWLYERTRNNIEATIAAGRWKVEVVVNGMTPDQGARCDAIHAHFRNFGQVRTLPVASHSRAGALDSPLVQSIGSGPVSDMPAGCKRIVRHLHVSYEGKVYICCQDYRQEVLLGDLSLSSVEEIMSSRVARVLRAAIYGRRALPPESPCRRCVMLRRDRFFELPEARL